MPAVAQTATHRVADFVSAFDLSQAPVEVHEKAKVTLLHDLGVAAAGHDLAGPALSVAKELGACTGSGGARVPFDGSPVTVEHAAFATAAMMHARTQDDTQLSAALHLGCTTLPALLALGDRENVSGAEFLTAMIAGYEAASAIAEGFAGKSTTRGFRATSVYGAFASAAASARLMRLSTEQTAAALGLAASFGGGTSQTWVTGTQEWQHQVGVASRNGLLACLLASRGVAGAEDALEGVAGHYSSFAGDAAGADAVGRGLGSQWRMLDVTYKPYPICAINQVPVTVLNALLAQHDLHEDEVDAVTLKLAPQEATYPGTDAHGPFTGSGATLMSAPYCLAVAIRKRDVRICDLHTYDDPSLMALARRVSVVPDDTLPGGSCRITVSTRTQELRTAYISTPQTFNWDRSETVSRLRRLVGEMPFDAVRLDELATVALDLEHRELRDLVTATLT